MIYGVNTKVNNFKFACVLIWVKIELGTPQYVASYASLFYCIMFSAAVSASVQVRLRDCKLHTTVLDTNFTSMLSLSKFNERRQYEASPPTCNTYMRLMVLLQFEPMHNSIILNLQIFRYHFGIFFTIYISWG